MKLQRRQVGRRQLAVGVLDVPVLPSLFEGLIDELVGIGGPEGLDRTGPTAFRMLKRMLERPK